MKNEVIDIKHHFFKPIFVFIVDFEAVALYFFVDWKQNIVNVLFRNSIKFKHCFKYSK